MLPYGYSTILVCVMQYLCVHFPLSVAYYIMNTYQKGNRRELEARKILESQGWLVDRKNRSKFSSPDLFGMFDLIAISGGKMLLVQVKSNKSDYYKARRKITGWKTTHAIDIQCQVWLKENNKDWIISDL